MDDSKNANGGFEFPSDNPELFVARPPSVAPPPLKSAADYFDDGSETEIEIVESFDESEFEIDADVTLVVDPVRRFVGKLQETVLAYGATIEMAAAIGPILGFERLDVLNDDVTEKLIRNGLLASENLRNETIVSTAQAWRGALSGSDPDFSACGTKMLDEWAADIVARVVGAPEKVELFRRDLRARGIAAFGMLDAA